MDRIGKFLACAIWFGIGFLIGSAYHTRKTARMKREYEYSEDGLEMEKDEFEKYYNEGEALQPDENDVILGDDDEDDINAIEHSNDECVFNFDCSRPEYINKYED